MSPLFAVTVSAGSLRTEAAGAWSLPHPWTPEGVHVEAEFNGACLFLLSVAGCVLNDVYREAEQRGLVIDGVRVNAQGAFDDGWVSTGVDYSVVVATDALPPEVDELLAVVDEVSEMPRALRAGAEVRRTSP